LDRRGQRGSKEGKMKTAVRQYDHASDYERVGQFLVRTYDPSGDHVNWLQPRWEYMHYHPLIRQVDLNSIGLWEVDGEIVGVVHPELSMGTAYFQIRADCSSLKSEMLAHAETHISVPKAGGKSLGVHINDRDAEFQALATEMGYRRAKDSEPMSHFVIPKPFPEISLPDGFRLIPLADDNDLAKLNRLIFRGFNNGNEPPDDGRDDRKFMQSAPNYRLDLNIVVVAPDGGFASYCGMWYEPVNRIAYVEPVCTVPEYRRMGLGTVAVREGIRRCGEQGATVAYVGTAMPFYKAVGFTQIYNRALWTREWA
jgi:predicted N-acetyltransferase YhbS